MCALPFAAARRSEGGIGLVEVRYVVSRRAQTTIVDPRKVQLWRLCRLYGSASSFACISQGLQADALGDFDLQRIRGRSMQRAREFQLIRGESMMEMRKTFGQELGVKFLESHLADSSAVDTAPSGCRDDDPKLGMLL